DHSNPPPGDVAAGEVVEALERNAVAGEFQDVASAVTLVAGRGADQIRRRDQMKNLRDRLAKALVLYSGKSQVHVLGLAAKKLESARRALERTPRVVKGRRGDENKAAHAGSRGFGDQALRQFPGVPGDQAGGVGVGAGLIRFRLGAHGARRISSQILARRARVPVRSPELSTTQVARRAFSCNGICAAIRSSASRRVSPLRSTRREI